MTAATLLFDRPGTMPRKQPPEPGLERFATWLRQHMEARGLSQRQVAAYADVAPTTVGLWLREATVPQPGSLKKLAEGLGRGVTYRYLVSLIDAGIVESDADAHYDRTYDEFTQRMESWLRQGRDLLESYRRSQTDDPPPTT